jgi:predicted nucleic acid-binding protein
MICVIDTSAPIRLFVPDGPIPRGLEKFLQGVELGDNIAIAPELLLVKAANVLARKRKMGELSEAESAPLLADVLGMPIRYFSHGPLIPAAFDLSLEHGITLYDAVYLALALEKGAILFSADEEMQKIAGKIL